jgi:hypothetical protein
MDGHAGFAFEDVHRGIDSNGRQLAQVKHILAAGMAGDAG